MTYWHSLPGSIRYHACMIAFLPKTLTAAELEAAPSAVAANELVTALLDRKCIDEIRQIERATGRDDVFSGFIRTLERNLAGFGTAFSDYVARGDTTGAERAAHTLKGTCHQLGARALGDLFAEIQQSAKAGDYAEAKRRFDTGASLIAQSIEALKHA